MTGVNVYNVREANNWLKKMGVNNLKFSTSPGLVTIALVWLPL